jgi:hypothetical protein
MQRQTADRGHVTKVEVMYAQKWLTQWEKDKSRVLRFSRKMMGAGPSLKGMRA